MDSFEGIVFEVVPITKCSQSYYFFINAIVKYYIFWDVKGIKAPMSTLI